MDLGAGIDVGPYRLDSILGQGGMGVVYRAHDTKLNRTVALKVLSSSLADAAARQRFQREAQTASSLSHPHIIVVHDAGEFAGRQYLVTELAALPEIPHWWLRGVKNFAPPRRRSCYRESAVAETWPNKPRFVDSV